MILEIYQNSSKKWSYRFKQNGKSILTSKEYDIRVDAKKALSNFIRDIKLVNEITELRYVELDKTIIDTEFRKLIEDTV